MTIASPATLRFSSYQKRSTMGDLSFFKPGDTAVLSTLTREGSGYREKSSLIKITDITPHQGKTVNGVAVERAHDKSLETFDEVDLLTYRIQNSRDTKGSEIDRTMLCGQYVQDDGTPRDHYGDIIQINNFDAAGKPYHCLLNGDDNPEEPAVINRILPVEDYVSWSVNTRNDLTASLTEARKTFWKKFWTKK